ncbi:MAG: hypothetical protein ACFCGT_13485 [Sandaracinaceae bacterium]
MTSMPDPLTAVTTPAAAQRIFDKLRAAADRRKNDSPPRPVRITRREYRALIRHLWDPALESPNWPELCFLPEVLQDLPTPTNKTVVLIEPGELAPQGQQALTTEEADVEVSRPCGILEREYRVTRYGFQRVESVRPLTNRSRIAELANLATDGEKDDFLYVLYEQTFTPRPVRRILDAL